MPLDRRSVLVTNRSSPTSWTLSPSSLVSMLPAFPVLFSQAILDGDRSGYFSTSCFQCSTSSSLVKRPCRTWAVCTRPSCCPYHSLEAASMARTKSLPGYVAGLLDGLEDILDRLLIAGQVGSEAALIANGGSRDPCSSAEPCRAWKTSVHQRRPSLKLGAPAGMIMNSCTSTVLAAWAPPLRMFIIGTGRLGVRTPPR